jgi:hypothetical protein
MTQAKLQKIQWVSAIILPIGVIWLFELVYFTLFIDLSFMEELGPRITRTILWALPILTLILFTHSRVRRRPYEEVRRGLTWATVTVLLLMLIVSGIYVFQILTSFLGSGSVGSAMWLAVIIFPAPIYIPILMIVAYGLGQAPKPGSHNQGVVKEV